jgi:sugar O-acyltransferase (sialic acid O-acetyltransferase NeuD family)
MNNKGREIGFIGFGELGKQIASMMEQSGYDPNLFRYFDDHFKHRNSFSFHEFLDDAFSCLEFVISIGYQHLDLKEKIIQQLMSADRIIFSFIHPNSFISPSAKIGEGVVVYPMCNIDQNVTIESGVLLNNSVTISHNCTLGSAGYYSPGVILSGNVSVGSGTFIGSGSIISNGIKIGQKCQIGIGTVITNNLPDNSSVIGNPARQLNRRLTIT